LKLSVYSANKSSSIVSSKNSIFFNSEAKIFL
jgi:hypothetical protein